MCSEQPGLKPGNSYVLRTVIESLDLLQHFNPLDEFIIHQCACMCIIRTQVLYGRVIHWRSQVHYVCIFVVAIVVPFCKRATVLDIIYNNTHCSYLVIADNIILLLLLLYLRRYYNTPMKIRSRSYRGCCERSYNGGTSGEGLRGKRPRKQSDGGLVRIMLFCNQVQGTTPRSQYKENTAI